LRKAIAALAVVFLAAHLAFLPLSLEDVDSINFALGVADFDVAKHQPHPPGYPVFIGLRRHPPRYFARCMSLARRYAVWQSGVRFAARHSHSFSLTCSGHSLA
jgi:hypothetical protein